MTSSDFIQTQERIGCSNVKLASWLGITPLTVTRYRTGYLAIPGPVAVSMQALATGWRPTPND